MPHVNVRTSLLLIVDMQTGLLPAIDQGEQLISRVAGLAQAAALMGVPIVATEHCRDKIGETVDHLKRFPVWAQQKTYFDATREPDFIQRLGGGAARDGIGAEGKAAQPERSRVLLTGAEAHICVLQTGLGLQSTGFAPVLVKDCIGSRRAADQQAACERWSYHGLETVTAEMAMFEWLESASHSKFRDVIALIKDSRV